MPKVCVQIVTWNSARFIEHCLASLEQQQFADFSVQIIDNASVDNTLDLIRSSYPTASVLQNFKNVGFAKAHNQGFQLTKADYILVLNPDAVLTEDFLEVLVAFADQHPQGAAFGGKVFRLASTAISGGDEDGPREVQKSEVIDTTGLAVTRGRQFYDRGAGSTDARLYNQPEQVFGISGACVLYRASALAATRVADEFFDEDFFSYKEDIDLAWRLQLAGWQSWYVPAAIAYHRRGLAAANQHRIRARRAVPRRLRELSLQNQIFVLLKNEQLQNLIFTFPWIVPRQLGQVLFAFVTEPFQWRGFWHVLRFLPRMLQKRRQILGRTTVSAKSIRQWFT